jgi:hypothetical protein
VNNRFVVLCALIPLGVGLFLAEPGCGSDDGLPRQEISGAVTLDG